MPSFRRILAALAVAVVLGKFCAAQEVKLPAEIKGAVGQFVEIAAVSDDATIKWHSVDAGLNLFPQRLLKDTKIAVVTALVPGRYRVMAVSAKGDVPSDFALCTVVIGNPGPAPPGPPQPPPGPPDPPDPQPAGPRTVMIFHESGQQTPAQGILFNQLRSGDSGAYLRSKGHKVHILDDDSVSSDGKPALESWAKHLAGITLPALVIADDKGNVVFKGPCPETTAAVLDTVKAHGG